MRHSSEIRREIFRLKLIYYQRKGDVAVAHQFFPHLYSERFRVMGRVESELHKLETELVAVEQREAKEVSNQ